MIIKYLFSSPDGDISLGPENLTKPFLTAASERHPFLTLSDYFDAIKEFILKDHGRPLVCVLREVLNRNIDLDDIHKILIRSEKHGVLYHLASVEIFIDNRRVRLCVSTAVSGTGKKWLRGEYEILTSLNESLKLPYLPQIYFKGNVETRAGEKGAEILAMFLGEWFENYHEWHISLDKNNKGQEICIWDRQNGTRYASRKESFEIFRQASRILTLYYDADDFSQIYPWHHAAGDFIVKTWENKVEVRLTTARKYQSIMGCLSKGSVNPMIAAVYFFLNLTVRIRLDKLDGVGGTVWAGDFSVDAAIEGFFEALRTMNLGGRFDHGKVKDLLSLLQSFKEVEIEALFQPLLGLYENDSPADIAVIQSNLKPHVKRLCQSLQGFRK